MAITTLAAFIAAVAAHGAAGITQKTAWPSSLNTADLPCTFPAETETEEGPMTFEGGGGWPILRTDLVCCVKPVGQSHDPERYAALVAALDTVAAALRTVDVTKSKLHFDSRWEIVEVGGTNYNGFVMTIQGRG